MKYKKIENKYREERIVVVVAVVVAVVVVLWFYVPSTGNKETEFRSQPRGPGLN